MRGSGKAPAGSPRQLVGEIEGYVRALLRDVLCGYLDADLKSVADDILLETNPEFLEIEARDLRQEGAGVERPSEPEPEEWPEAEEPPEPQEHPEPEPDPQPTVAMAAPAHAEEADTADAEEVDTSELEPVALADAEPDLDFDEDPPPQPDLDGVTPSDDWACDDPEDYSAPV
jgi:hypothetical protein